MLSNEIEPLLHKNQLIANSYKVDFFVGANKNIQTYRATMEKNAVCVLHLITHSEFTQSHKDAYLKLRFELTTSFFPDFYAMDCERIKDKEYHYIVEEFKTGEYLSDRLRRCTQTSYFSDYFIERLLQKFIELDLRLQKAVIFNSINPANIWIDMANPNENFILTNLLHAHFENEEINLTLNDEYFAYQATEILERKAGTANANLFSLAVVYYQVIYGKLPWELPSKDKFDNDQAWLNEIKKIREKGIKKIQSQDNREANRFNIICKALSEEPAKRFSTARDFLNALRDIDNYQADVQEPVCSNDKEFGFNAIAGMEALKESLQKDVINAIKNKDKYEAYGLNIPNGLLLYGPPGCGKTFFAEKLAEEISFSFFKIKPSDLQSKYVNESQEKIKNLFDQAREKKPSIIFIDEIDAIAPSRSGHDISHMYLSAVNELLVQMNNSGKDQVFVVAATNIPESIDPALLRTGRLDKKIYISKPDKESRMKLFLKILEDRPVEQEIDFGFLADKTKELIASDIKFICDEAARNALVGDRLISENDLLHAIQKFTSSDTEDKF